MPVVEATALHGNPRGAQEVPSCKRRVRESFLQRRQNWHSPSPSGCSRQDGGCGPSALFLVPSDVTDLGSNANAHCIEMARCKQWHGFGLGPKLHFSPLYKVFLPFSVSSKHMSGFKKRLEGSPPPCTQHESHQPCPWTATGSRHLSVCHSSARQSVSQGTPGLRGWAFWGYSINHHNLGG